MLLGPASKVSQLHRLSCPLMSHLLHSSVKEGDQTLTEWGIFSCGVYIRSIHKEG